MEISTFNSGGVQASHHRDGKSKVQERDVFSPGLYKILQTLLHRILKTNPEQFVSCLASFIVKNWRPKEANQLIPRTRQSVRTAFMVAPVLFHVFPRLYFWPVSENPVLCLSFGF